MCDEFDIEKLNKAKSILRDYKQIKIRKEQLEKIVNKLKHQIQSCKSPSFSDMPPVSSKIGNATTQRIANLVDTELKLNEIVKRYNNELLLIEYALNEVAEQYGVLGANILHYKFVDCLSLEKIAEIIKYTKRQTIRIYNTALAVFYQGLYDWSEVLVLDI